LTARSEKAFPECFGSFRRAPRSELRFITDVRGETSLKARQRFWLALASSLGAAAGARLVWSIYKRRSRKRYYGPGQYLAPAPSDRKLTVVVEQDAEDWLAALHAGLRRAEELGWIDRLDNRVIIEPALNSAASPTARLTTTPVLLEELVTWLRDRRNGIQIELWVSDLPGRAAAEMLRFSGLSALANHEGIDVVNLSDRPHAWWEVKDIPVPLPASIPVVQDTFRVSLATLATHPLERLAGIHLHHLSSTMPAIWESHFDSYRSRAMYWATQLIPPDLCLVDGQFTADFSTLEGSSIWHTGMVVLGRNAVAVDTVAARLMGVEPKTVPALMRAYKASGLGPGDAEILGDYVFIKPVARASEQYYDRRTRMVIDYVPYPLRRWLLARLVSPSQTAHAARALWRIVDRHWPGFGL
jgi:uncharacterized protein (DUF362 family)